MSDDEDEKVGPGRPPRKYRFQKGQSGNPRGRPKNKLNMNTIDEHYYDAFFDKKITIRGNNGPELASPFVAMLMLLRKEALNGDSTLIEKILDRIERRAAAAPPSKFEADRSEDDEAVLRRFLRSSPDRPADDEPPDGAAADDEGDDG